MVRDYTKWDDTPVSLGALRRIRRARLQDRDDAAHASRWCSSPTAVLQEEPDRRRRPRTLRIPKLVAAHAARRAIPAPSPKPRKMLVAAENPVIVAGRVARTPEGIKLLVELAETAAGAASSTSASA